MLKKIEESKVDISKYLKIYAPLIKYLEDK